MDYKQMKVKTQDLTGAALDWAVAKADGSWIISENFEEGELSFIQVSLHGFLWDYFTPSLSWEQGGPIIEREMMKRGLDVWRTTDMKECSATYERGLPDSYIYGKTPLIAAMRCYVSNKLGDEVEIPKELE